MKIIIPADSISQGAMALLKNRLDMSIEDRLTIDVSDILHELGIKNFDADSIVWCNEGEQSFLKIEGTDQ